MSVLVTLYRHRDPRYHADFPSIALAPNGDLLLLLRRCGAWAHDATFRFARPLTQFEVDAELLLLSSSDDGATWREERVLERGLAFDPMLCVLPDGRLMAGAVVGDAGLTRERGRLRGVLHRHLPQLNTVISVRGIQLWLSEDNARTWSEGPLVACPGWENIYNLRPGLALDDGTLMLPVTVGYPWRTRYVGLLRSWDDGRSWGDPSYVAEDPAGRVHYAGGLGYWQPAMQALPTGELVCVCVLDEHSAAPERGSGALAGALPKLMRTHSVDSGFTWSVPQGTGLEGDYPSLRVLPDERLLLTYTERGPEGGSVCAQTSSDGGVTWQRVLLCNEPGCQYQYPQSVALGDGAMLTVCMTTPPDGVRMVQSVRWALA